MREEILSFLDNLERPLDFSSRNEFSNIDKLKNLDRVVEELTLKILSLNPPADIEKRVNSIRNSFRSYEGMELQERKRLIEDTLSGINRIRALLKDNYQQTDKQKTDTGNADIWELRDDIRFLKGIGPALKKRFEKKQVEDIEDLLFYFPRKYEDRRKIKKISDLTPGQTETVVGSVLISGTVKTRKRTLYNVVISDGSANLSIVWFRFNQKYLKQIFRNGAKVCVNGEVVYNRYERTLQIIHPNPEDIEVLEGEELSGKNSLNFNRIVPVYPLTEGLTQKRLRSILSSAVDKYACCFADLLPDNLIRRYDLCTLNQALREIHYPDDSTGCVDLESGVSVYRSVPHRTFSFFEFLLLELSIGLIKMDVKKKRSLPVNSNGELERKLLDKLHFSLTGAQARVLSEIKEDMHREYPMNRLLQGDVGSGKTIIAVLSMLNIIESGYQAALMAPTEILAEQHMRSICGYLGDMDVKVRILRSGLSRREREKTYDEIRSGDCNIVVGTHALIEEKVEFNKLGMVVVDEQHRFGVLQRSRLVQKAVNPHVLVMTATPIPRTLAITVYGDLDLSVIDEMPAGRKKIETRYYKNTKKNRKSIYSTVKSELDTGRQAYFVCPMIESSEDNGYEGITYATDLARELDNDVFRDYRVGLLHGRMTAEEKDTTMRSFVDGELDILVSTTVIEVGVDVPNATIMVIENSERFGLSQLHQLRGRIGRGGHRSKCILVSSFSATEDAEKKIRIMCDSEDGFVISEEDLKLRGPGDFLGTKQSGIPTFRFADIMRDYRILSEAREAAFHILKKDPDLAEHNALRDYLYFRKEKPRTPDPVA